jgi:hypothetical protein
VDAEELTRFGQEGPGAGQLNLPRSIATDSATGHVYLADTFNQRIGEFTPWGEFVKAFGWDVAPGGVNEEQEVRVRAAAGQFKLGFGADTTSDLAFNASALEVESALNALPSLSSGGRSVSVREVIGNPNGTVPYIYIVTFAGGPLAGSNVEQLTAVNGTTPLSGGSPSTNTMVRTRANGAVGSTGLEACTAVSGCKSGLEGSGAGQLSRPAAIASDSSGNLYVFENRNLRVQKFGSSGEFLLMFGGEVDKTNGGNVCTAASGHVCGVGVKGSGQGQFYTQSGTEISTAIAVNSAGHIFVGDKGRIQEFEADGTYKSAVTLGGGLSEKTIASLAMDSAGDFYLILNDESGKREENVIKVSPTGSTLYSLQVKNPQAALATDAVGNVYVVENGISGIPTPKVLQFDPTGKPLASCCAAGLRPGVEGENKLRFTLAALGTNLVGDLYVANTSASIDSFVRAYGPAPVSFESPPPVPPGIVGQFAGAVDREDAELRAEINPHFWTDTRYYVEYGTGKCSEGGCENKQPVPPGAALTSKVVNAPVTTSPILLKNLQPGTTYYYRFVAESGGGGPVRGVGGEVGDDGAEAKFLTFAEPIAPKLNCPNQIFRTGLSATLPDCRAYEMVSPIDKGNGDVHALIDSVGFSNAIDQSATNGDKFTYSSYLSFGEPQAAPYTSQYISTRGPGVGWSSEAISPVQGHLVDHAPSGYEFENEYKAFSSDLCSSWLMRANEPLLASGSIANFPNLYRRGNCGEEGYEALTTVEPTEPGAYEPELQGTAAAGTKAIFRVRGKLTPDATSGVEQLYEVSGGQLHLVCILPNGTPNGEDCSAGIAPSIVKSQSALRNRYANVTHAISVDGSRIYWTSTADVSGAGKIYLRQNADQQQSALSAGECTEVEKACTLAVTSKVSRFDAASLDGRKALFTIMEGSKAGNLEEFSLDEMSSSLIAKKVVGTLGASDDLSYIYFVSTEVLDGAAKVGSPNLYLAHDGSTSFIATLSAADVLTSSQGGSIPSNTATEPVFHAAKVNDNGHHVVFISTESLTGYDNIDQSSGEADSEVYSYEAGSAGPLCISCVPSGARPSGRIVQAAGNSGFLATAASTPAAANQLFAPNVLSEDGSQLFFNSYSPLLPQDTNGKEDVYEWERASSQSQCEGVGATLFVEASGGCLSLISSGESPSDSEFLDATSDGRNVFFSTASKLLQQDPGLIDIYDARVEGGFPPPVQSPAPCEGEACQKPPPPPNDSTPASSTFEGAGNVRRPPHCRKGKVYRKGRCVAKRKHAKRTHRKHRPAGKASYRGATR